MEIKEYKQRINISQDIFLSCNMDDVAYFDIETTGFDREHDNIILISFGRFLSRDDFEMKQYFSDVLEDEREVIYNFGLDVKKYSSWCSYNGIAFDEPFIKERAHQNNMCFKAPGHHIDLYRLIRPYYKQLGMERCNLKTVEKHVGIDRKDKIDGGISVDLYKEFLESKNENIKKTIMLHNYEDVLNLPKIHEFACKIKNNNLLVREDCITEKQLKYLKILLKKNNIQLDVQLEKVSKRAASHVIDHLLKGENDCDELVNIINNSY
ncbi:ribonuclease H-like domain-containing protein [Clostridium sp. 001]|uniref:ribonuclease H-like domain-containing protein n=1 Tax=Clostridium sp. 001 TaxID=1970093 RepID=UPI001C2B8B88|nr:ribonuclease H-like domain-containing protein [Clostridium sp. 001]QXE17495.1 hypothetical protein B5S50_00760 [Clostridium sp. 001]